MSAFPTWVVHVRRGFGVRQTEVQALGLAFLWTTGKSVTTVESPPIKQGIEISMIVNEFTGGSTVGSTQGAPHGARARGACCYSYRLRNQDTWFLSAWSAPVLHARCASS